MSDIESDMKKVGKNAEDQAREGVESTEDKARLGMSIAKDTARDAIE